MEIRTKLERILLTSLVIVSIVTLCLLVAVIIISSTNTRNNPGTQLDKWTSVNGTEICLTESCIEVSNMLVSNMNKSADPCQDFYEFMCGGWESKHVIPDDKSYYGGIVIITEQVQMKIKKVLEAKDSSLLDFSRTTRAVKQIYDGCMNETAVDAAGITPLIKQFQHILGTALLPLGLDHASYDGRGWLEIMGRLASMGTNNLINLYARTDAYNSSTHRIYLDQPTTLLPSREFYLVGNKTKCNSTDNEGCFAGYRRDSTFWTNKYISSVKTYLLSLSKSILNDTSNRDDDVLVNQIEDIIRLDAFLGESGSSMSERRERSESDMYNLYAIEELTETYPHVDWVTYLQLYTQSRPRLITNHTQVVVREPKYFTKLNQMLQDYGNVKTDSTILRYLLLSSASGLVPYLSKPLREQQLKFSKVTSGVESEKARWKQCVETVNYSTGPFMGVAKLYVTQYFPKEHKIIAEEIIAEVLNAYRNMLGELDWLDTESRERAEEKLTKMTQFIGFPEDILDNPNKLDKIYENVLPKITDKYFDSVMAMKSYYVEQKVGKIGRKQNRKDWSYLAGRNTVSAFNAYYYASANAMVMPAGIWTSPMFYPDIPAAFNFGNIALVIGHEFTHGFDDKGREYDVEGNLAQWWTNRSIEQYKQQKECIVDQYSDYKIYAKGKYWHINGTNTQGENIADNGGQLEAYNALKSWMKKEVSPRDKQKIPGFENYSHEQYFFMANSLIWCELRREEAVIVNVRTAQHSPGKFRLLGPRTNMPEFADAFNCPVGSPMNPSKKCRVW